MALHARQTGRAFPSAFLLPPRPGPPWPAASCPPRLPPPSELAPPSGPPVPLGRRARRACRVRGAGCRARAGSRRCPLASIVEKWTSRAWIRAPDASKTRTKVSQDDATQRSLCPIVGRCQAIDSKKAGASLFFFLSPAPGTFPGTWQIFR